MTGARILHGNAVVPYQMVEHQTFHTEFAARLFGLLTCKAMGPYFYWVLES